MSSMTFSPNIAMCIHLVDPIRWNHVVRVLAKQSGFHAEKPGGQSPQILLKNTGFKASTDQGFTN